MSLYKRRSESHKSQSFYYKLYCPKTGKVVQGSTGTANKAKAQEFHDRLKASLWDENKPEAAEEKVAEEPAEEGLNYLWQHAVLEYLRTRQEYGSLATIQSRLRWLDSWLKDKPLIEIDKKLLNEIKAAKQKDEINVRIKGGVKKSTGRKVQPATVNRVLKLLLSVLNVAVDMEWLDKVPKIKLLSEPKKRIRWLAPHEAQRLLALLPTHLADMAQFSLETGMRRANVTGLEWSQIDLARKTAWIHPDQAKARKPIGIPLSDEAMVVLMRQREKKRHADYTQYVFVYEGKPVKQTSTKAWYKALKAADIKNFRWHDLRHTWASWHVQRGTPLYVLKELGGWETLEMVQRYAHLSSAHLAQWAQSHTVFVPSSQHAVLAEKIAA